VSTSLILRTLRMQAWERAKAELQSVAATFHSSDPSVAGSSNHAQFSDYMVAMVDFIHEIESNGLAE